VNMFGANVSLHVVPEALPDWQVEEEHDLDVSAEEQQEKQNIFNLYFSSRTPKP